MVEMLDQPSIDLPTLHLSRELEQGNYSLRRPPKLTIPHMFIEQKWATVYRFM